ncbi:MAG: phytoene desaturase [Proteobacteria bacterium]|nr:phytoene desaturase [Pseudomonadota bacterium]MCP4922301.1 phytoene desaturase [Pseudomonadota bacterium]
MPDVVVVGAGFGGLAAAVELAAAGRSVRVLEAGPRPGGRADEVVVDGVACDVGPTLMTLPDVARAVFEAAGTRLEDEVELVRPEPAFRYHFPDGTQLDVHHDLEDTLAEVESVLGGRAAGDLERHLERARRIWGATAGSFIYGAAPSISRIVGMGPRAWLDLARIDAHRTLWDVICEDVSDWRLRWLLARYATYNGSDVRRAPGTLACIAWVEMGIGAWGVRGGLHALARALERVARRAGVEFQYDTPVREVLLEGRDVVGVGTEDMVLRSETVVCNADAMHVRDMLPARARRVIPERGEASTSGWVGIVRAARRRDRVAHEVVFPAAYLDEYADLFDRRRTPRDPTVYSCALAVAHGRDRWADADPLFVMVNAPALGDVPDPAPWSRLARRRLTEAGLMGADDPVVWERTPRGLATRYPGTAGAIYGAASNTMLSSFRRPANRVAGLGGLFLAGGSAHPGGGVPLCLQSGRRAARELLAADARRRG